MRFKLFAICFLLSSVLFGSQVVELSGDKSYPPYSYEENGVAKGVYVDILKSAFSQLKDYDLKLNMMAYKRAISMTKSGKTIGFFPPYYSEKRRSWTKFSEPILSEKSIVFAKEGTLNAHKNYPKDFYGLTACLNRGFGTAVLGGDEFAKAVLEGKIKLIEANDNKACLNRVSKDKADFYINDQLIDTSLFNNIKRGQKAKENFGHIGFTLKDKNYPFLKDLEKKFNSVIRSMKESGEIENILNKYKK
ncbi:MAG: transporter substrate-binding domain-containing protein [Campylobacterota bacterium]|nr:transporter substrate-binding domain-containing protein [Campylobacterota bacterium]